MMAWWKFALSESLLVHFINLSMRDNNDDADDNNILYYNPGQTATIDVHNRTKNQLRHAGLHTTKHNIQGLGADPENCFE